jgi:hypothetical protein
VSSLLVTLARSAALREETAAALARSTELFRRSFTLLVGLSGKPGIAGGSDHEALRESLRHRLRARTLPLADARVRAARATGRPCTVCEERIDVPDREYVWGGYGAELVAHQACYALWLLESELLDGEPRPTST